jgi:hypothetical protein
MAAASLLGRRVFPALAAGSSLAARLPHSGNPRDEHMRKGPGSYEPGPFELILMG